MSFIKGTISRLKQRWPTIADIYRTSSKTVDFTTGNQVQSREHIRIPKAVVLPEQMLMQLSGANISEGANFGGNLPSSTTNVLIENSDLKGFALNIEDCQVVIKSLVYEIYRIQDFNGEATILILKAIKGAHIPQIFDKKFKDYVHLQENLSES